MEQLKEIFLMLLSVTKEEDEILEKCQEIQRENINFNFTSTAEEIGLQHPLISPKDNLLDLELYGRCRANLVTFLIEENLRPCLESLAIATRSNDPILDTLFVSLLFNDTNSPKDHELLQYLVHALKLHDTFLSQKDDLKNFYVTNLRIMRDQDMADDFFINLLIERSRMLDIATHNPVNRDSEAEPMQESVLTVHCHFAATEEDIQDLEIYAEFSVPEETTVKSAEAKIQKDPCSADQFLSLHILLQYRNSDDTELTHLFPLPHGSYILYADVEIFG
jgi:hypothetical protein